MNRRSWLATALVLSAFAVSDVPAKAQWGFPMGFDAFGWGGWGVGTVAGDEARGLGMFAEGLGFYNKQTAEADAINADTIKRWNEYLYQSQLNADIRRRERAERRIAKNTERAEMSLERLRNSPDARAIHSGDALNVALNDIDDPRVYASALKGANAKISSDQVRAIPFRYNAAAVTVGIHQLATGQMPEGLRSAEFAADRDLLKSLDEEITRQVDENDAPDQATVKKLLAEIYTLEEKATSILPKNSLQLKQAQKYLKSLHGLVAMLKTPSLDTYLAGVEKKPETTLGELLRFMNAFNLRFGPATTAKQREVYASLFPVMDKLRDEVTASVTPTRSMTGMLGAAQDFFSGMSFGDLGKSAPKP